MKLFENTKRSLDVISGKIVMMQEEKKCRCRKCMATFVRPMNMLMIAFMFFALSATPVMAAGDTSVDSLVGTIVGIILTMFRYVGIVLLVWGVAQFVMAMKRSDSESKGDAIQTIITAIVLIGLKTVVTSLGIVDSIPDVEF
ncbi:MAG: hypothetical protein KHY93_07380 [Clostridiales bacterium]|nr:hypothetical protein [Clostridiales bacterium]